MVFALRNSKESNGAFITQKQRGQFFDVVRRPESIRVMHFCTTPKPSDVILGNINKHSCGDSWPIFQEKAEWLNENGKSIQERVEWMAKNLFEPQKPQNSNRSSIKNNIYFERHLNKSAIEAYCREWYEWTWPTFLAEVSEKLELMSKEAVDRARGDLLGT